MYVYWWHVRGLRAVKVGHADNPRQRVSDYRIQYRLGGKKVRSYKLDSSTDAEWVESQLRRTLETNGIRRITLQFGDEEEELFALGGRTFEDAHTLLRETARHIAFAEISNQRKQQRRDALQVAQMWTPPEQEQDTNQRHEEPRPRQYHAAEPSPFRVPARLGLYLIGAILASGLVAGLVTGLGGDGSPVGPRSANLTEQKNSPVTTASQDGGSLPGPLHKNPCTLVELSDTLIHVSCTGSWALMRWNGGWAFDGGNNERDALDFFNASDMARRVVVLPTPGPVPELPQQPETKPERLPQSNRPVAPPAPPPQPRPVPAAPPPATAQPAPLPVRETPLPRKQCAVSRPKPGFQVYLVTCPNSQVMIGRTVDSATGWTVSESVNGTEAIEFFMKSPYAR